MNTKTFGYVRVSTAHQNEERELLEMRELGIGDCGSKKSRKSLGETTVGFGGVIERAA